MIEVCVESIRVNMTNDKRVVMLKEKTGDRYLPIWIGHFEADGIAIPMQKVPVSRPLTLDLLVQAIQHPGGRCTQAAICRLEKETFFARLVVDQGGRHLELDCRPSDAISVAIRARVPIFVDDELMARAARTFDTPAAVAPAAESGGAAYLPSAEPAGGSPPSPFEVLGAVTQPVLMGLERTIDGVNRARRTAIGPGDLLLGLLQTPRAAANRVLSDLSVDGTELRRMIEQELGRDRPRFSLTEAAERVVRRSIEKMARLEERTVGSEHLLLALAGERESSVGVALEKLGVSVTGIRRQIAMLMMPPPQEPPPPSTLQ